MVTTYVSLARLSELTGLPESWLRARADEGVIPALLVGRRRMFDPAAVRVVLAERANAATEAGDETE